MCGWDLPNFRRADVLRCMWSGVLFHSAGGDGSVHLHTMPGRRLPDILWSDRVCELPIWKLPDRHRSYLVRHVSDVLHIGRGAIDVHMRRRIPHGGWMDGLRVPERLLPLEFAVRDVRLRQVRIARQGYVVYFVSGDKHHSLADDWKLQGMQMQRRALLQ